MDVRKILSRRIDGRRLFHSYIIAGGDDEARAEAAKYVSAAAVCENPEKAPCGACRHCQKALRGIHPDISVTERKADKKEITIDLMRAVRSAASVLPNEAAKSVYIIKDADLMNAASQNAMLKAFEEPAPHVVFLLTAANPERLIPTVRSRCEEIILPPAEEPENPTAKELVSLMLKGDSAGIAKLMPRLEKLERQAVIDLPPAVKREALRAHLAGKLPEDRLAALVEEMDKCDKYAAANVSAANIAGVIVAAMS